MKKLVTKIDDDQEDIFISKNIVRFKDESYRIEVSNGSYIIIDKNNTKYFVDDIIDLGNKIVRVEIEGYTIDVSIVDPLNVAVSGSDETDQNISSPLAGSISNILVKNGDSVDKGDIVIVISAMKMENKIACKSAGIIENINVKVGDQVSKGEILIEFQK